MNKDRKIGVEYQLPPLVEVSLDTRTRVVFERSVTISRSSRIEYYGGVTILPFHRLLRDFHYFKDAIKDKFVLNPSANNRIEFGVHNPVYLLMSWEGNGQILRNPDLASRVVKHGPFTEMPFYDAALLYSDPSLSGGKTPFPAHPTSDVIYIPNSQST